MKKKTLIENILDAVTVLTIIATFLFALVGISFNIVYVKMSVKGYSMYPILNLEAKNDDVDCDVVFINQFSDIKNNDIVVANVRWWPKGPIIKRVVASPGDVVQIKEHTNSYSLYVNNKFVYSKEKTTTSVHGDEGGTEAYYQEYLNFLASDKFKNNVIEVNGEKYIYMQKDEYFLLGDNWGETTDSMQNGPVHIEKIAGRVDIIVPYGNSPIWAMVKAMFKLTFVPNWV